MIVLDIDPNVVKPGWTPLIIIVLLGIAVYLLYRSMRHQFAKIAVPRDRPDMFRIPSADDDPASDADDPNHASDLPGHRGRRPN